MEIKNHIDNLSYQRAILSYRKVQLYARLVLEQNGLRVIL